MIAGIREAVGPDIEVLIDAHALYYVPTAIRLANRLAPYRHLSDCRAVLQPHRQVPGCACYRVTRHANTAWERLQADCRQSSSGTRTAPRQRKSGGGSRHLASSIQVTVRSMLHARPSRHS